MKSNNILNIAFYHFIDLTQLQDHRREFSEICQNLQLKGTILLSTEGINGMLAGAAQSVQQFQKSMVVHPVWKVLAYKESYSDRIPFRRLFVKLKKEVIPVGDSSVKPAQFAAPKISPLELKQWLDENRQFQLLDTRNQYEIQLGTFEKAQQLDLKNFRQIPERLKEFEEEKKKIPVVMFCTGGIRCEKAAILAYRAGFKEVYQLDGGILKYFEQCGGDHYQGSCFVFDERIAVNPDLKPINSERKSTAENFEEEPDMHSA